jgi:hypothetical protein
MATRLEDTTASAEGSLAARLMIHHNAGAYVAESRFIS